MIKAELKKTKTYKYVLLPTTILFFTGQSVAKSLFTLDIVNAYIPEQTYDFVKEKGKKNHIDILVRDTPAFRANIKELQESEFYISHHSVSPEFAILKFKVVSESSFKKFLNSEYSKMYDFYDKFATAELVSKLPRGISDVLFKSTEKKKELYRKIYGEEPTEEDLELITECDSKMSKEEETFNTSLLEEV